MDKTILVKGTLVDSSTVQLAQPVSGAARDVEVLLSVPADSTSTEEGTFLAFLKSLPPGTRTKEEIDHRLQEERESWGDR